jgi:hypothetical protein
MVKRKQKDSDSNCMFRASYLFVLVFFVAVVWTTGTGGAAGDMPHYVVPPPPFSDEGVYPCSTCHAAMQANTTPRELSYHTEIKIINHAEDQRWCLSCHDAENRDMLRLASGKLVSFDESYKLCGQCHGNMLRSWKAGVHGKRTGYWNADKLYRLCAHCHNPHQPAFKALKPLPPPDNPKDIQYKSQDTKQRDYKMVKPPDEQFVPEEEHKEGDDNVKK